MDTVIRKGVRSAMVLLAALVIPLVIVAAPPPASAAGTKLCEAYGSYCLNTANFSQYTPVTESANNGRTISAVRTSDTYNNQRVYILQFDGATSKCVASSNDNTDIVIKDCNGGNNLAAEWLDSPDGNYDRWISVAATMAYGSNIYLSGQEKPGSQYRLFGLGVSGAYQVFYLF
jgi:hypothetical protein